ncbi:hypothetical protein BDI4_120032 [Burkholderia diffusa]|nr:hypothetical protein BDI4_120032 [Burkholderia diffusa]
MPPFGGDKPRFPRRAGPQDSVPYFPLMTFSASNAKIAAAFHRGTACCST